MEKKRLQPIDLLGFTPLGDPQVSPDGKKVAFVREYSDIKKNAIRAEIWIVSLDEGIPRKLTSGEKRDTMPRWSPDGSRLAFVSDRNGKSQLYLIDPEGGEAQVIATKLEPCSPPAWSPDGKTIAFVAVEEMKPDAPFYPGAPMSTSIPDPEGDKSQNQSIKVIKTLHHKQNGMGFFGNRFRHVFTVAAQPTMGEEAEVKRVTDGRYNHDSPAWSPDGRYIACVANRDLPDDDPVWIRHLWVFEVSTGEAVRVLTEEYPINSPVWSPDGTRLAFIGADHPFDWVSSPYDLFVVDFLPEQSPLTFDRVKKLTAGVGRWVGSTAPSDVRHSSTSKPCWSSDGKSIYFLMASEGQSHVWRVASDGSGSPTRVTPGEKRSVGSFSLSRDGTVVYFAGGTVQPDELYAIPPSGEERKLTALNAEFASQWRFIEPERIVYKGADGWDIEGWLMKPVDYEPGKRYPTVLSVHGGPSGMYGYGFMFQFQLLANHCYAVLYINPRGSSGYSREFSLAVVRDWGGKDYEDLMAGVDFAVKLGVADPERLGITGWSYGGIMTCWAITQTQRFKAAVAGAPIADHVSAYGTADVGSGFVEFSAGGTPWKNPEALYARSALRHMGNVVTPLLLIHGENDLRCPVAQSEEVFTALVRQGKTCVMVRYPGEPHGLSQPRHIVDRLERTLAWFDYYLK